MRKILKGAVVLLIAFAMVFSTAALANTQTKGTKIEFSTTHSGSAVGSRGDIVWDNGMHYTGLAATQYDASNDIDTYLADDFHFEEPTDVSDVHWIGGYWGTDYQSGAFDWCISFMFDDGSGQSPDSHPSDPSHAGPFCFTWSDITIELLEDTGSSIYYELSVDLPYTIAFPPCEKFWIAIWAEGTYPPQSGWGYHEDYMLTPAVWGSDYFGFPFWTPGFEVQGFDFDMAFQLTTKQPCEPSIDVEKYVWDEKNQDWVDADTEDTAIDVKICKDVTFKIVIHNDGTEPLFDVIVGDKMSDSLKFISGDPQPDEYYYEEPFWYMFWHFPGPLNPCDVIEIYITAHVEGPECSYDFNYVLVEALGCGNIVRDDDYAWVHEHDRARGFNSPILNFLQSHPNMFPLLQLLLQQFGVF